MTETVELKPGGAQIPVTEANKAEFIRLLCEHRLKGRVEQQLDAFNKGLYEIVPEETLKIFDERELEVSLLVSCCCKQGLTVPGVASQLLIGGLSDIDVEDWEKHTDYRGYDKDDQAVKWFWQAVKAWPVEKRSRLLQVSPSIPLHLPSARALTRSRVPSQFATGTSRTPVNGFRDLQGSDGPRKFTIEKVGGSSALPKTHTCFNRIDLPAEYPSFEV